MGNFNRLALTEPKLAPYGAAALDVLTKMNLQQTLQPRLVFGENIVQTYQFINTGNAELGFVALAQVLDNGKIAQGFRAGLFPQTVMHLFDKLRY
jgi:molybdate transport system substrate-binding protein